MTKEDLKGSATWHVSFKITMSLNWLAAGNVRKERLNRRKVLKCVLYSGKFTRSVSPKLIDRVAVINRSFSFLHYLESIIL